MRPGELRGLPVLCAFSRARQREASAHSGICVCFSLALRTGRVPSQEHTFPTLIFSYSTLNNDQFFFCKEVCM